MAVSKTPRFGLTRWSAGTDPFSRAQMDESMAAIEANAAMFTSGTLAARPAFGKAGRFYEVTDAAAGAPTLFYDTGTAWKELRPDLSSYATIAALTAGLAGKAATVHTHTRGQITDFAHSHSTDDLTSGTLADARLPGRIREQAAHVADLNTATTSGWYHVNQDAANAPLPYWGVVLVVLYGGEVHQFFTAADPTAPERASGSTYRRWRSSGGAWSAWQREYRTVGDLQTLPASTFALSQVADTTRLGRKAQDISDWNLALDDGWFMGNDRPNAPAAGRWFLGLVLAHNDQYVVQTLVDFTNAQVKTGAIGGAWRRIRTTDGWGAWYRVDYTLPELDDRFPTKGAVQSSLDALAASLTSSLTVPAASYTTQGKVELATFLEVSQGADDTRAVTPAALAPALADKAGVSHTHDDRYFTEAESNGRFALKSRVDDIEAPWLAFTASIGSSTATSFSTDGTFYNRAVYKRLGKTVFFKVWMLLPNNLVLPTGTLFLRDLPQIDDATSMATYLHGHLFARGNNSANQSLNVEHELLTVAPMTDGNKLILRRRYVNAGGELDGSPLQGSHTSLAANTGYQREFIVAGWYGSGV